MLREWVREYLTFTRKERVGVLSLVVIVLAILVLPYLFKKPQGSSDPAAFAKYKPVAEQLFHKKQQQETEREEIKQVLSPAVFYFDPNKISPEEWERLGIREKTIHTIEHFLERGGKFRDASDLGKIYGLSPPDCRRLMPYVRIKAETHSGDQKKIFSPFLSYAHPEKKAFYPTPPAHYSRKKPTVMDINQADSESLVRLPGIGMKLAARIVHFREKLGGFFDVGQVAETFGLPDSVFQSIRPFLVLAADTVRQIDLNRADQPALQQHPYIRWDLARAIIRYREQHGGFKSVDELQQLVQVNPEKFKKLQPYLKVGK